MKACLESNLWNFIICLCVLCEFQCAALVEFLKWTRSRLFWWWKVCFVTFIRSIHKINISHGFCWCCEMIFLLLFLLNIRWHLLLLSLVGACVGDYWLNVCWNGFAIYIFFYCPMYAINKDEKSPNILQLIRFTNYFCDLKLDS